MTRKDYVAIAEAINWSWSTQPLTSRPGIAHSAGAIAAVLLVDNARFDPKRFHDACFAENPVG